jgi:hypothetical protein
MVAFRRANELKCMQDLNLSFVYFVDGKSAKAPYDKRGCSLASALHM